MIRLGLAAIAAFGLAGSALAVPLPDYPNDGTENPAVYSFTKLSDGDLIGWFVGRSAALNSAVFVRVNGVEIAGSLSNTVPLGTSFNWGFVAGGSTIDFILRTSAGTTWWSDKSLNVDGVQHIYSDSWAGGETIGITTFPLSTYVYIGWEDLPRGGDFDYNDHQFVFENVGRGIVPEPATWAMMIMGFGLVGLAARRRTTAVTA
jgi:hypothetical protein